MTDSDRALVRAAKRGDEKALTTIFDRHWLTTWRAAFAVTQQRDLADDAAQDAFIRAFTRLDRFDEDARLAPWLAKIAINRSIDLMRRQRRERASGDTREFNRVSIATPAGAPGSRSRLIDAVAQLPLERRLVVVLHIFLGLTLDEVADALDLPLGTVASRLGRALATLRTTLKEHDE